MSSRSSSRSCRWLQRRIQITHYPSNPQPVRSTIDCSAVPSPGSPGGFFFLFFSSHAPLALHIDWLLRHAALTMTHVHVVLHLATCSKQLASLLLLALFVRQASSSIQHTGLVAQWLDLHFLNSAVPQKKGCRVYSVWPPRGGVRWFPQWFAGPPLWDGIPSVETFSTRTLPLDLVARPPGRRHYEVWKETSACN